MLHPYPDIRAFKDLPMRKIRVYIDRMYLDEKDGRHKSDAVIYDADKHEVEIKRDIPETTDYPHFGYLSNEQAQQLANDLWECGIRPTQGHGSTGQLEATNKHLQDMRKIVLNKLGLKDEI